MNLESITVPVKVRYLKQTFYENIGLMSIIVVKEINGILSGQMLSMLIEGENYV